MREKMSNYTEKESRCGVLFHSLGDVFHLWTSENHEIIFTGESDFRMGMSIFGVCAKLFPDVRILTFELMTNHIHVTAAADENRLRLMFDTIKLMLQKWLKYVGRQNSLTDFRASVRLLDSLEDVRNVIAYDNRNGFLVNPSHTPFTYLWGANRFYYSPDSCRLARMEASPISLRERRRISHSRIADSVEGLLSFDGYALPLSFCDISTGELLFRGASHYFCKISRSIESSAMIAKEIGESIWYTDDELYLICLRLCKEKYGVKSPILLDSKARIDLAKSLHFDYNAGAKQLQRMLKISTSVLDSMGF